MARPTSCGSSGTPRGGCSAWSASRAESPGRRLDLAVDGHAGLSQRNERGRARIHRLDDERAAALRRSAGHSERDLGLLCLEIVRELAVAAEIARHEGRIDLAGLEDDPRHLLEDGEELLAGAREVDGIARGRRIGKVRGDPPLEVVRERWKLEALGGGDVGGDDPVPAPVAHDDDPSPARLDPRELCLREIDELARRAHALHPGRTACGFDCRGAADQRAGVGPRGLGTDLSCSDGEEDDGLPGLDRFLRGAREGPSVAEILAVEGDHTGRLVVDQAADELARLEVGLVPERREAREAEPVVLGEQGELEREVAALGDEADRAALQLAPAEVEARRGVEDPETVRPEEDGARRPNALDNRGLPGPALVACLPEPGGDPDERFRARGERCVDGVLEPVGGNRKHDELRRLGQVCQRGVGLPLEDFAPVPVHEIDRAAFLSPEGAER